MKRVAVERGWEVVALDRDLPADIETDILDWDYREFEPNHLDFIWASPPCTEYSIAKTTGVRNLELANSIVRKTLEVIDYLQPKTYIIENPQTGLLKKQHFMENIPFTDVDYCKYGMPYRKRTRLWSNRASELKLQPLCKRDCNSIDESGRRHKEVAQKMPNGKASNWKGSTFKREELYKIPEGLIDDILTSLSI